MRVLLAGLGDEERARAVFGLETAGVTPELEFTAGISAPDTSRFDLIVASANLPGAPERLLQRDDSGILSLVVLVGPYPDVARLANAYREGLFDWVESGSDASLSKALERAAREVANRQRQSDAEAQLRENEERYRIVSSLVSDYVYSVRLPAPLRIGGNEEWSEHSMEWIAGAFEQVTGYTADEVNQIGYPTLLHPEDIPAALQFAERLNRGERSVLEYRIRHKDGSYRWLHDICQPVWNAERSAIVRLLGGVQDITERKLAETALRESRALLHSIFRIQSSFIEEAEDEEVFTELLSGMLVLTQCERALVLEFEDERGFSAHTLARENLGASGQAARRRVPAASQLGCLFDTLHTHTPLICNGGAQLDGPPASWLDLRTARNFLAAPLIRANRTHGLLVLVNREGGFIEANLQYLRPLLATCGGILAARKQARLRHAAEASLRESEGRWRFALEGNADGVWDYRVSKQQIYFSPVWKQMLGHTDEDIPNDLDAWFSRVYPDDIEKTLRLIQDYFQGRATDFEFDYRMRHKDGTFRWIHDRGMIMERAADGTPTRIVGTHRDVTDRYLAEEKRVAMELQALQAQKLESLGILAGGIAHDFNNILTSIIGYTDLVLLDTPQDTPVYSRLQQVLIGARRAADLTRQLLAYSGKGQFVIEPVDVTEIVRESCLLLHVAMPQHTKMVQELAPDLPSVTGDATQIRQVVINLITNAAEAFQESAGTLTVRTAVGTADSEGFTVIQAPDNPEHSRFVVIDICDTGVGMDEEMMHRIFDPFFSTKFAGRGLGLASALGIIRGHHGGIYLQSAPGEGTTFRVLLPVSGSSLPTSAPMPVSAPWRTHGTVLVVDDEPAVRQLASTLLERLGFVVLTAETGEEGLEIFRAQPHELDLVLLDLSLPGMDGAEVLEILKAERPELRVLLTSGYSEQFAERRLPASGAVGFVAKPYRVDQFGEAIRAAMEGAEVAVRRP